MADPHSSGHHQSNAAVSQKRTIVDAAVGGGSAARPATAAAKRPCFTCTCSGQACYCGAATAAAAVAAAAATAAAQGSLQSRDPHGAAQSGKPDSRWCSVGPPAASSPSAHRASVSVASLATSSRATGTAGQYAVSSANTTIASPRQVGNHQLNYRHLQTHTAYHQHRHQSGNSGCSSSGATTYLRASPRAAAAAPPALVSSSASEIINDLMRSVVTTSVVTVTARPSVPASSAGLVSARPRAASGTEVQVSQATSMPLTVVWPPGAANGSSPSTPGTVVHYVPGSLGDIRQQAAASTASRLVAERRLFRCTTCEYFTTQQHKLAAHAEFYHSGKARPAPIASRMAPGVGQSHTAAAAVSAINCGVGSRTVLSSPTATVSAVDAAVRNMSVATATGRASHTPEHRAEATVRGGLTPHGSGEPSPLRATTMTNASGSAGAGLSSGGIWWPPTPGSKPLGVPAGTRVEAARPPTGTISCPFCSFKATLPNLLQLHVAKSHGGQLQAPQICYQRSSSHPASHTARVADVLPTPAAISPQTAAPVLPHATTTVVRTADDERSKVSSADHDDPDVIITSWTIGPAGTAVQSSRLPPAPFAAAAPAASPSESAISLAATLATAPDVDRQFTNAPSETLPPHSIEAANSVVDPLPLSCRPNLLSPPPPPLLQSPASVASGGSELMQQLSSSDRLLVPELPPPPPPPPPLLPPSPAPAPAEVELVQLSSSDRQPLCEPSPELLPSAEIPIPSQASNDEIGSKSPSLPVATHTPMTSAGVVAEQQSVAGIVKASTSSAGDSPAAAAVASLPTGNTVAESPPPPVAVAELAEQPCVAAAVAGDAPLHAIAEPASIVDKSHVPLSAVFTWEELVSIGMECAPLYEHRGSSAATAASAYAASATEKVLKAKQQPSPSDGSNEPSYFWSEQLMLGELLFEDCDESAATTGQLPRADEEPQKRNGESVSAAGAVDAYRSQSESVNRLQDGRDHKLHVIGAVGSGDGGATSAQSAIARSSGIPWSGAGEGCVSREAPAAGACAPATCGGVTLVHAGPRDTPPSSSSSADAASGGGASSSLAPSAARRESDEPLAAGDHPCRLLPALSQDKLACAAELGEPIAAGNGEYNATSAASISLGNSPFVSGPTSLEQHSKITSVEQPAAYLPNGRSLTCSEKTKPEISNVFTATCDATTSDNLRDPDDSDRALMSLKADMLPVFSADGMQGLLKHDHETGDIVSPVISGHSHDMTQEDDNASRSMSVDTAEKGEAASHAADGCYRSGIEPLMHNDKSLPAEDVGYSRDGGKETTSFSSPGPAVATRQRRLQQGQQLTNCGSSSSPSLVRSSERPAKRRSCLLAMDRVRETSACRKHKVAKGTGRSAAEASSSPRSTASKLRRLVKHAQPRCSCCVSPAMGGSGSRVAASRLASAKKLQCSKRYTDRAAATRRRCSM